MGAQLLTAPFKGLAGIEIAGRMIASLKKNSVCDGVHIMAIHNKDVVPDILAAAELNGHAQ